MNMNKGIILVPFVLVAALLSGRAAEMPAVSALDKARAALNAHDLAKASALLEPLAGADGKDAAAF